ncbi:MAG TPA: Dyp-type peroxidase, partial [Acidimicrobiales bacterium]|nr:Dyp-type peroxidase [Acidimicrobiales bacterium]
MDDRATTDGDVSGDSSNREAARQDRAGSPGRTGAPRRGLSRRELLASVGGSMLGAGALAAGLGLSSSPPVVSGTAYAEDTEPFYRSGAQGGITTTPQAASYFASFDVTASQRSDVRDLLRAWSAAAARLTVGEPAAALSTDGSVVEPDSMDALGIGPSRLTVTVGLGTGLFDKEGEDRFGLASRRPAALVELPRFPNDQLIEQKTGGDLTIQACADDAQVAFHAVRQLARLADGACTLRWGQAGFNESAASEGTPRNLMGFKDGTINPSGNELQRFVFVGDEGPAWMRGGSYLVARRIRISLEHWDRETLSVQQQVIGRHKASGAPLGETGEFDPLDLDRTDGSGNPLIPLDAHVRLASPQLNKGQMILRRSYAYNDGMSPFVERWPPWQEALLYDAGLLFMAYQRDPRLGFIAIFQNLAENDALGQFTTQTGSVIVALPPAAQGPGHFVGE